jgi:hypothetical protein
LRLIPSDQFTSMTLVIDGQSTFTGQAAAKQYVWLS